MKENIRIAAAQISPVWLNREATLEKVNNYISQASKAGADLVAFGEAFAPGYPFWVSLTDGARFESEAQKEMFAWYSRETVQLEACHLTGVCVAAKAHAITVVLGIIERPPERGGHSLYCSLVMIGKDGKVQYVHRKLVPTYEERLVWSPGDGHGLETHSVPPFTVGALNCWENWMPLPRTALYGLGENLHIAVWPGSDHNTKDITRFIARESRSFVISVSSLMQKSDFPKDVPHYDKIVKNAPEILANGGSCIAGPDGEWIIEPVINKEGLVIETLDFNRVLEERQNFDCVGHYSRPDVTKLYVNRERQSTVSFDE